MAKFPDNEWQEFRVDEKTSDVILFTLDKFSQIGYSAGMGVALMIAGGAYVGGYSFDALLNQEWWEIFLILAVIALTMAAHELLHFVFSNWNQSKLVFSPEHFSLAVHLQGEYSMHRYLLCLLAPSIVLSVLFIPAAMTGNAFLMFAAIVNLAGSGLDWISAFIAWKGMKAKQVLVCGDQVFFKR